MAWKYNDLKDTPSAVNLWKTEVSKYDNYDSIANTVNLLNVTYDKLKGLRDSNSLIAGQFYRITDYITTTTQADTQSAGHQFDVIVRADTENVLNENAFATQTMGGGFNLLFQ